jgi:branched-chain amino acid aminotransferase
MIPERSLSSLTLGGMFAYVNGVMVEETNAAVTVFDHGLTVGDGVFETIALRQGTAKSPTRHLARLARSASGLGLPVPDIEELHRAVGETIAANPGIEFGALRVTYTSGPGTVGSGRDDVTTTTIVAARHLSPPPAVTDVVTVPWPRNERGALAGLKTTSYAENVKALAEARKRGASEAIFANTTGALCEGSGTNVFVVIDGQLITPPLSAGCLAGITRGLIIERAGVDVQERDVPIDQLRHAEEAFITSAIRDIQAIASVDDQPLGSAPGPLTQKAMQAYAALLAADPDPA